MVASSISTSIIILIVIAIVAGSILISSSWFIPPSLPEEAAAASYYHRQLDGFNDPKTVQLRATVTNDILQTDAITQVPYKFRLNVPNVLLIGAQKAGSTSIADYMFAGGVCRPRDALDGKETHFFDHGYKFNRGAHFLMRHFHHCKGRDFIMDATPNTFMFPQRVYNFYRKIRYDLSRLKFIIIIREPISRELSLYNYKRSLYSEGNREFWVTDVVNPNDGTIIPFDDYATVFLKGKLAKHPEMATSFYADHLKRWMSFFKREQLLILSFDELKKEPTTTLWRIQKFLGTTFPDMAMPHSNTHQHYTEEVPQRAKQTLDEIFGPKNQELYQFMDEHPGPPMEQYPFPRFEE